MFNTALNLSPSTLHPAPPSIRFTDAERRVFASRERDPRTGRVLTVSQWAERYRILTDSNINGRWQNANAPYAVLPMDLWTHPTVREIYLCFAPQIVKTQIAINCMLYAIDQDPGPIMYVMPDEKTTKRFARNRLLPTITASPRTAALLSPRDADTTQLGIRFVNSCRIMLAWATSTAELSSEPVRYYIGDEVSKWPGYAAGQNKREASPIDLLRVRANSYTYTSKGLFLSSPAEDPCAISDLMQYDADVTMRYKVPCPVCGTDQVMDDEHIVILHGVTDFRRVIRDRMARYACDKCGMYWDDFMRKTAIRRGHWVPGQFNEDGDWVELAEAIVNPVAVALHLPSWYNVNMDLSDKKGPAVAKMRQGEGPEKRQIFFTQHRAEKYKEVIEIKKESKILEEHRTDLQSQMVPEKAFALVAGIDSHTWGYRFIVYALIEDAPGKYTMQKIHHGLLESLEEVEDLVYRARYTIEGTKATLGIWRAAIDTGGNKSGPDAMDKEKSMTSEIYGWLRQQVRMKKIYGVKGASQKQDKPVKESFIDQKDYADALKLRLIDTSSFKVWLHWRLDKGPDDKERILFDADTGSDFVRELVAEEQKKIRGRFQWVKIRNANHYLDCTVYALAAIDGSWSQSLKYHAPLLKQMREQLASPAGYTPPQPQSRRVRSAGVQI